MLKHPVTLFALAFGLLVSLDLAACGNSETAADPVGHAGHDHAGHAGHGEAAEADQGEATEAAMGGMAKVDTEGAVRSWDARPEAGAKGICPVSGEAFVVTEKTVFSEVEGKFYGHCCPGCQAPFEANPQQYLSQGTEG